MSDNHFENNIIKFIAIIMMVVSVRFLVNPFLPQLEAFVQGTNQQQKSTASIFDYFSNKNPNNQIEQIIPETQIAYDAETETRSEITDIDLSYDHMVAPKLNIDDKIVYTDSVKKINKSLWDRTTNLKNKNNRVIIGHSIIEIENKIRLPRPKAGVFYNLEDLESGDLIYVVEKGIKYTYEVYDEKLVHESEIWVEKDTKDKILTLYSCRGANGGKYGSSHRIVVFSKLISQE